MTDVAGHEEAQPEKPVDQIPMVTSAADYPTVYSDGVWFAANLAGNIRLTFLENLLEPVNTIAPGMKARHVGTLVMPRHAFNNMVAYLIEQQALFAKLDEEANG